MEIIVCVYNMFIFILNKNLKLDPKYFYIILIRINSKIMIYNLMYLG
jgi:hypothetical protein